MAVVAVVAAGTTVRAYNAATLAYVGYWVCTEASELGIWEWRE